MRKSLYTLPTFSRLLYFPNHGYNLECVLQSPDRKTFGTPYKTGKLKPDDLIE